MPAPAHPPTHLLYLHGFRSSPQSFKARLLHAWLQQHAPSLTWWCPQLPPSPRAAWQLIRDGTSGWPAHSMAVLGSSLGGFYATVVAEAYGCPAVVLNPAVDPARDLAHYIGDQTAYHDPALHFRFEPEYVDELRALTPARISDPSRYAAVIAKGDELLDWREMSRRYAGSRMLLLEGSDHALSDFAQHLGFVLDFLRLRPHTV
ncbi:MAG: esterase [Burkholderiaceae bacterium]|nr:esterase [Burkholderiaceae bacterium]